MFVSSFEFFYPRHTLASPLSRVDEFFPRGWGEVVLTAEPSKRRAVDKLVKSQTYTLRTALARTPDNAGFLILRNSHTKKSIPFGMPFFVWLGRSDSNTRMTESESVALPLGDAPIFLFYSNFYCFYLRYFIKLFLFWQAFLCSFMKFFLFFLKKGFFFSFFDVSHPLSFS